ncbi:hypothetical protein KDL01_04875 [Actinospica durhamensis]|uniref:Uncharacterized protein n=1 Tax=Actinospica durhamensis TaxID=1508375 RepID=A0A941ERP4_9ACTN|nr:hypothetical protein [Actinospica durhamensis]MBR7832579.1 hypothetical protein [Actinospica durhamensis]
MRSGRILRGLILAAVLGCGTAACSPSTGRGPGLNDTSQVQAMIASWKSGTCPESGALWETFDQGLPEQAGPVPDGRILTLAPAGLNRVLLCRFSDTDSKLDGSALLTTSASIAPLAAALNTVTTTSHTAACVRTGRVMILAGDANGVVGLDLALGCPYLDGPEQLATYAGNALPTIVDADLAAP